MANPVNPIDYANEDLAAFLAKSVDDGTYEDVVEALKSDSPGNAATATQIPTAAGQIWSNLIDDFFQASYPLLRQVATGGGGSDSVLGSYGGFVSGIGLYVDSSGPSSGGVAFTRNYENTIQAPFDGTISRVQFMLGTGNINQDFKIWVADVDTTTINNSSGGTFWIATPGTAVSADDKINIEFDAGAIPGNTRIDIIIEAS